jgi:hypothetical protein
MFHQRRGSGSATARSRTTGANPDRAAPVSFLGAPWGAPGYAHLRCPSAWNIDCSPMWGRVVVSEAPQGSESRGAELCTRPTKRLFFMCHGATGLPVAKRRWPCRSFGKAAAATHRAVLSSHAMSVLDSGAALDRACRSLVVQMQRSGGAHLAGCQLGAVRRRRPSERLDRNVAMTRSGTSATALESLVSRAHLEEKREGAGAEPRVSPSFYDREGDAHGNPSSAPMSGQQSGPSPPSARRAPLRPSARTLVIREARLFAFA